jgi:2-oxoglutarate ferredoxin oxidoreductase subunit alpha
MVKLRQAKVDGIADYIPLQTIDNGDAKGKLLVLGWGSTYGTIKVAVKEAIAEGYDVSHAQVKYLNPFPKNLGELLKNFDQVLIPEINNGQLIKVIRDKYFVDAKGLNKIKGLPFTASEIKKKITELLR